MSLLNGVLWTWYQLSAKCCLPNFNFMEVSKEVCILLFSSTKYSIQWCTLAIFMMIVLIEQSYQLVAKCCLPSPSIQGLICHWTQYPNAAKYVNVLKPTYISNFCLLSWDRTAYQKILLIFVCQTLCSVSSGIGCFPTCGSSFIF